MSVETGGHLAALACAALWAVATVLFGKSARTVDARALNLLKCGVAAIFLGATALAFGDLPNPSARDWVALVASVVLGIVIADTAFFVALNHLGTARGALFISLVPFATSLFAAPALGERLTPRMLAGMLVTLAGVTVVVRERARPSSEVDGERSRALNGRGILAGVAYCVAQGGANVLVKGTDPALSPLALSFIRLAMGAVMLAVLLASTRAGRATLPALKPVFARGALATFAGAYIGLVLGTYALRTVTAGVATTLVATTPLFALAFARVIDGERVSARTLAGAILAFAGVAVLVS